MNKYLAAVILGIVVSLGGCAKDGNQVIDLPAYRPPSDGTAEASFRERLGETSITVFPTVVRDSQGSSYSQASRATVAEFLVTNQLASATESDDQVDLSASAGPTQHDLFKQNMALFAQYLEANPVTTEYALLVECLVTPTRSSREAVGGIQCYILDGKGRNAFSFLMNSHHRLFNEANLKVEKTGNEAREALIDRSTRVVLESLRRQLPPE
jgi:hypothetical protein